MYVCTCLCVFFCYNFTVNPHSPLYRVLSALLSCVILYFNRLVSSRHLVERVILLDKMCSMIFFCSCRCCCMFACVSVLYIKSCVCYVTRCTTFVCLVYVCMHCICNGWFGFTHIQVYYKCM